LIQTIIGNKLVFLPLVVYNSNMFLEDSIVYKIRFTNIIYLANRLWPNEVDVSLHLTPCDDDPQTQHTTFEKYKYCFHKIFQNSLFVTSKQEHEIFKNHSSNVIDIPVRPVDQMTGVCVYSKLNAIGGDHLKCSAIEIESWQGENIRFIITENSPEWDMLPNDKDQYYWWNDSLPNFTSFESSRLTWEEIGFKIENTESNFTVIQGNKK